MIAGSIGWHLRVSVSILRELRRSATVVGLPVIAKFRQSGSSGREVLFHQIHGSFFESLGSSAMRWAKPRLRIMAIGFMVRYLVHRARPN